MKYLLVLLLLGLRPALASQIVVGLRSDNLISWGVWEREGTTLKHYLLLYNKSAQPLDVSIREKRFQPVGTSFTAGTTHKRLFSRKLAPGQWVRLRYPESRAKSAYLEYFEHNVSVGLLPLSAKRPDAAALASPAYRYYTNEGASSGELRYWLAFNSLEAPPAHLRLTVSADEFRQPARRGEEAYGLVRLYPSVAAAPHQPGTLDSLFVTGRVPDIARLDSAHQMVLLPAQATAPGSQPAMLVLLTENVETYFRYNEQRQLVPDKSVGGALYFLPFFPSAPH
jgi:hypothetical protein